MSNLIFLARGLDMFLMRVARDFDSILSAWAKVAALHFQAAV
jgi:hypothetical protein